MGLMISNGIRFTKLWENPKPTEDFAATRIDMDLSPYDAILIFQRAGTSLWILIGQDSVNTVANVYGNGQLGAAFDVKTRRYYTGYDAKDHITISDCQATIGGSGNWVAQNGWCVPVAIYGVNF